jgi:hypothetical protein
MKGFTNIVTCLLTNGADFSLTTNVSVNISCFPTTTSYSLAKNDKTAYDLANSSEVREIIHDVSESLFEFLTY